MKKLSEIYKELGIAFTFPILIEDSNGYATYYENSDDYWERYERHDSGNPTYYEDSNKSWKKWERDADGGVLYYEDSDGCWDRYERDANGGETYYENSYGTKEGTPRSAKTCEGKVVEVDGIKYKLTAL